MDRNDVIIRNTVAKQVCCWVDIEVEGEGVGIYTRHPVHEF